MTMCDTRMVAVPERTSGSASLVSVPRVECAAETTHSATLLQDQDMEDGSPAPVLVRPNILNLID